MEQQPFDKAIKESLDKLEVPFEADHWQQMELLLNNLPVGDGSAIDAHFDSIFKNKLNATPVPPPTPEIWSKIEKGIEYGELADAQFDDMINQSLGSLEVKVDDGWEQIDAGLELAEQADLDFDKAIYASLQSVRTKPNPGVWNRVINTINDNLILREKLYRYKLAETTVIILLLLQFYQYIPTFPEYFPQKADVPTDIFEELPTDQQEYFNPIHEDSKTELDAKINPPIAQRSKENSSVANNIQLNSSDGLIAETPTSQLGTVINNDGQIIRNKFAVKPIGSLLPEMEQRSGLSISVGEMNQHLTLYTEGSDKLINTVPSLSPSLLTAGHVPLLGCKNCNYRKIPAQIRLGLVGNVAVNNAYISGGQLLDINALNQRGIGYGSGFSIGFKYGRWEIETGLNYAAKQYDPNIVDLPHAELKRTHFQTVHLQNLHLPVNLRFNYAVLGKGKWHLYAQTGAALNVIMRAEYDLAEVSSISRSRVNDVTTFRLNQIDYNNGLIAGDGFKSNRYISINMGVGAERFISPTWSIFVQPDFHFHFSGTRIGPTEDRINTLSLSFGARKSL